MDHRNLASFYECHVYHKCSASLGDDVPDLYYLRLIGRESFLECGHYGLVATFSCALRRPFRARLVGFLKSEGGDGENCAPVKGCNAVNQATDELPSEREELGVVSRDLIGRRLHCFLI